MGVTEVKRLRELERENAQLKQIVAKAKRWTFGCSQTSIRKILSLPERRAATYLKTQYSISERRICKVLGLNRSTHRYRPRRKAIDGAHQAVVRWSERYNYWGYRKIHALLHQAQVAIGRDRVRLIRRLRRFTNAPKTPEAPGSRPQHPLGTSCLSIGITSLSLRLCSRPDA
jgi:putative transposase